MGNKLSNQPLSNKLHRLLLSPALRPNQHLQCQKGEIHTRCVQTTTTPSSSKNASSSMLIRTISSTRASFPQRLPQPSLKIPSKNPLLLHSLHLNLSPNLRHNLSNPLRPAQLLPLNMSLLLQLPLPSLRHLLPQHSHLSPPRSLLPLHSPLHSPLHRNPSQSNPSQRSSQSLNLVTLTSCARITSPMRQCSIRASSSTKTKTNSLRNQLRSLKEPLKVLHLALNSPLNLSRNPLSSSNSQLNSHNPSLKLHLKLHLSSLSHSSSHLKSPRHLHSKNLLQLSNHLPSLRPLLHNSRRPNQLSPSSHQSLRRLPSRNLNSHLSPRLQSLLKALQLRLTHPILAVLIRASLLST